MAASNQQISPTTSPYTSVDITNNQANNNNQQYHSSSVAPIQQSTNLVNNNVKYHQPPQQPLAYNGNGHLNGNGPQIAQVARTNVVQSATIPSGGGNGGISNNQQMQQALQQKYYDQYENYARPNPNPNGNGNGVNNNGQQNGMSQSTYSNGTKAYGAPPPQMTNSYNQQMAYNNHYNHQNGSVGVGKISDYDPLTDGPRNVPQTGRANQTLIYSSDRTAASEYPIHNRINFIC